MAKFLNKAGLILETNDPDKIECYKAKGLVELTNEPQPEQKNVVVDSDYVVRPAKSKKGKKGA